MSLKKALISTIVILTCCSVSAFAMSDNTVAIQGIHDHQFSKLDRY
jgi:hypothetical protein